jgi:rare lipoprotein A
VNSDRAAFLSFIVGSSLLAGGCARKPIVNRQPPASAQPSPTPIDATEAAKNTNTPPTSPSTALHPKRPKTPPPPAPVGYTEQGNASWYGDPFNGRHSSNGEIYDMNKLTAAHRTMPFETMVRVTNLNNGKTTTVRITDRGPFVDNRIIDLSRAAAQQIESIGPGVVPVRLEVLGNVDVAAGFFTVQVGAFRDRGNADRLRERLAITYSPIFIQQFDTGDGPFYRVRVGKISGEQEANQYAERLREKEGFKTMVLRLDEGPSSGTTK